MKASISLTRRRHLLFVRKWPSCKGPTGRTAGLLSVSGVTLGSSESCGSLFFFLLAYRLMDRKERVVLILWVNETFLHEHYPFAKSVSAKIRKCLAVIRKVFIWHCVFCENYFNYRRHTLVLQVMGAAISIGSFFYGSFSKIRQTGIECERQTECEIVSSVFQWEATDACCLSISSLHKLKTIGLWIRSQSVMQTEEGIIAGLQEDDDDADFLLLESLQCSTDDDEGSCSGEKTLGKGWLAGCTIFISFNHTAYGRRYAMGGWE